jgi:chromate transport protein ChrA
MFYLWQSGIEWAISLFIHLFMVLEHLISTNSEAAAGMYALAIGISHVSNTLPLPVYALLSGLNAATVGVIAFAAVQLATKAITDPLSRLIVVFSACAGMCYSALWYFPVLMVGGGISTVVWDLWARNFVGKLKIRWRRRRPQAEILEMTDATLPFDGRVQTNGGGGQVSRRSILSLKSTTGSVQLHGASAVA